MGVGGQHNAPAALPPGKTRWPSYRRLGESQGRSGRVRKILSPPGSDPRAVQPVASRYTDWAIPAHTVQLNSHKILLQFCYENRPVKINLKKNTGSICIFRNIEKSGIFILQFNSRALTKNMYSEIQF